LNHNQLCQPLKTAVFMIIT